MFSWWSENNFQFIKSVSENVCNWSKIIVNFLLFKKCIEEFYQARNRVNVKDLMTRGLQFTKKMDGCLLEIVLAWLGKSRLKSSKQSYTASFIWSFDWADCDIAFSFLFIFIYLFFLDSSLFHKYFQTWVDEIYSSI